MNNKQSKATRSKKKPNRPVPRKRNASDTVAVLDHFEDVSPNGDGWIARCPAHDDNTPSLSIKKNGSGKWLFHCFAGCEFEEIIEAAAVPRKLINISFEPPIEAKYDYRDENDKLLFQVIRKKGKKFVQRQPDGVDGWIYNLRSVRRVPYKLNLLLEANPGQRVYLAEGEKDADRLVAEGLLGTTLPGGAGKWRNEYEEYFADRHVVILPDNDQAGKQGAEQIAENLHSRVLSLRVLSLPDLPEGGDVSDFFDNGGTKTQLRDLTKECPKWSPGQPKVSERRSVSNEIQNVLPFPTEAFPACLQRLITEGEAAYSCPSDFFGVTLLSVLGAAIGQTFQIQLKPGYVQSAAVFSAIVARPGDRKSPVLECVTGPAYELNHQLEESYHAELKDYEKARKESDEKEGLEHPKRSQFVTTDATLESLTSLLCENPRGLLFAQDELSGWTRALGQYKGGRGNDRQKWLSLWSNSSETINRKSQDPLVLKRPFVCVTGCIQPDMLGELVDRRGREDGFMHRVLVAYPDPVPVRWTDDCISDETMDEYRKLFFALVGNELDTRSYCEQTLRMTQRAKTVWRRWADKHCEELNDGHNHLRGVWSKLEAYCGRLALILHRCRYVSGETKSRDVDSGSIESAVMLIEYFKSHAQRVYQLMRRDGDDTRIGKSIRWIRSEGGCVTVRQVQRAGIVGVNSSSTARVLLEDLAEAGFGTFQQGKRKDSLSFILNAT